MPVVLDDDTSSSEVFYRKDGYLRVPFPVVEKFLRVESFTAFSQRPDIVVTLHARKGIVTRLLVQHYDKQVHDPSKRCKGWLVNKRAKSLLFSLAAVKRYLPTDHDYSKPWKVEFKMKGQMMLTAPETESNALRTKRRTTAFGLRPRNKTATT